MIAPFQDWVIGGSSPWWKAFTDLKHDRIQNFRQATLRNAIVALAATFIILSVRNESAFKEGTVPLEVYDLFFPTYWKFHGRVAVMNFMWL